MGSRIGLDILGQGRVKPARVLASEFLPGEVLYTKHRYRLHNNMSAVITVFLCLYKQNAVTCSGYCQSSLVPETERSQQFQKVGEKNRG